MGRKKGRPTKLTDEVREHIADLIRRGNYLSVAATRAGVDRGTVRRWLRQGREARTGKYFEFRRAVEEAIVFAEVNDVEIIRKAAASGDWRAAAWRLEHRYPQRYKRPSRHEVTGKHGAPLETPRAVIYLPDNGRLPKGIDDD